MSSSPRSSRAFIVFKSDSKCRHEIELFPHHCEEPSCPPKPAFGRRRMRRSNPLAPCTDMDCSAEPVIRRRFAPTRWFAMTHSNTSFHWLPYRSSLRRTSDAIDMTRNFGNTPRVPFHPTGSAEDRCQARRDSKYRRVFTISRHVAPEFCRSLSPFIEEGAGNAGCPMHPSLACARGSKFACEYSQRRRRNHPAFPTRWSYALYVISPGTGLSCPRHLRDALASPQTWHQRRDARTTRLRRTPKARSSAVPPRPPHPRLAFRDDWP